jgi:hypothetical protein
VTRKSGLAFLRHLPSPPYPATAYAQAVGGKLVLDINYTDISILNPIGHVIDRAQIADNQ